MYIISNENALVCTGENKTKTQELTKMFSFVFFEKETETFENVFLWPGLHTHLETNVDADKVFEMIALCWDCWLFRSQKHALKLFLLTVNFTSGL